MNCILDTHSFIWFVNGDQQLSSRAIKSITNPLNSCYVSMASIWEIAIKISLGRLEIKEPFENISHHIDNNGFIILPITFQHIQVVSNLEFFHRDPFDRLIIPQSIVEEMAIITRDNAFNLYPVEILW